MKRFVPRTRSAAGAAALGMALAAWSSPAAGQDTTIRGFADVTYTVSDQDGGRNAFSLGQYDLFISSRLGEKWAFLGETVFEFVGGGFLADVERVVVEYRHSPRFRVALGRMHRPIGYWFTAYHHGALLEPTIDRPLAFRFEDEGGILTSHDVGLRLSGQDIGALNLGYDVLVGNGVSATPVQDLNEGKSVTARLFTQVDHATQVASPSTATSSTRERWSPARATSTEKPRATPCWNATWSSRSSATSGERAPGQDRSRITRGCTFWARAAHGFCAVRCTARSSTT